MPTILVATADGVHQIDGGQVAARRDVQAIAAGPHGDVWALVDGTELWRNWQPVAKVPDGLRGRCLLADGAAVLVGASEARLLRLADGSLEHVHGFDQAPGRDTWYTPWGGPPDTYSLSADGATGAWFVNVHVGGILRSPDRGRSWQPTVDPDDDVHQVLAGRAAGGANLVLAAAAAGLLQSDDGGTTWTYRTEGLHSTYARAVAVSGDTVLLTASDGPHGSRDALYRAPLHDPAAAFERCTVGPGWFDGNLDTGWLAASASADASADTSASVDAGLVAVATPGGTVYTSTDAGATWEEAAAGLPESRWVAITAA